MITETEAKIIKKNIEKGGSSLGEFIHSYINKKTARLTSFDLLEEAIGLVAESSLYTGCVEYIRLKDIAYDREIADCDALRTALETVENTTLRPLIEKHLQSSDRQGHAEAILALYLLGDEDTCITFIKQAKGVSGYVKDVLELSQHQTDLEGHLYEIIVYILQVTGSLSDYEADKCVRKICLTAEKAEGLMEYKQSEICKLAKWYFDNSMYMSLSSLMQIFDYHSGNNTQCKSNVYTYVGVSKEDFLDAALQNGTVKALDLYCYVKYVDRFPGLDEIKPILHIGSGGVYCVVKQCLRQIGEQENLSREVIKILKYIKKGIQEGSLKYTVLDEYEDRGMAVWKMDEDLVEAFQILCRCEQDVHEFVSLITTSGALTNLNIYGNYNLLTDYNISKSNRAQYANWQKEYAYICERYKKEPFKVVNTVMNTYLRFYVDPFTFFQKYNKELDRFWFAGFVKNDSRIRLVQEINNSEFRKKKYTVLENRGRSDSKENPEEIQNLRFKIDSVDIAKREIVVKEIQTIPFKLRAVMNTAINELLLDNKVMTAYWFLKQNDKNEKNLMRRDRFTSMGIVSGDVEGIRSVFEQNKDKYREELQYIYLNSSLKTYVPIEQVKYVFDEKQHYLANIYYEDNTRFETEGFFYIRPNYCTGKKLAVIPVNRTRISSELDAFIVNEMSYFKSKSGMDGKRQDTRSVRVCFYADWNKTDSPDEFVTHMYLHCCESVIKDLNTAMGVYYNRIHKINRKGISMNLLVKFMEANRGNLQKSALELEDAFCHMMNRYFTFMNTDLRTIADNPASVNRWTYVDKGEMKYYWSNLFYTMNVKLFDDSYATNEGFKGYVKDSKAYKTVLDALKSERCKHMRKVVYEITVVKYLYDSFDAFECAIESTVI